MAQMMPLRVGVFIPLIRDSFKSVVINFEEYLINVFSPTELWKKLVV
jgi:hypothetical protein